MTALRLAALSLVALLAVPATGLASDSPSPDDYLFTRINTTHANPRDMSVVIVPPAYVTQDGMLQDLGWVGPSVRDQVGVQVALEATDYWTWMIDQSEGAYPNLARLNYRVTVLGDDATAADVQAADIVILTGFVADPVPFLVFAGIGLPLLPLNAFITNDNAGQTTCIVANTGVGATGIPNPDLPVFGPLFVPQQDLEHPDTLRNLILHEFGHCLGAGHVGESLGLEHCNAENVCYENHPTDIMSVALGDRRQCLSNANMLSLAEGYAWLTSSTATWQPHDAEAYILKSKYAQTCMPAELENY